MLTQQQSDWLDVGIEHFNAGRFWHAHEDWEALWISLKGNASQELINGVQGIIQIAAMLLNHQRKKSRGVVSLWTKSSAKLTPVIDGLFGLDIASLYVDSEPFHLDVELFLLDATNVKIGFHDSENE
ncbi:MAG: DUF309 domain-containing protein [Euryarchaeota archaeon TMED85]|nr:MAG: hypothetical protein CMA04_003990 [Euryarchaeota archaeon]RPG74457.1 MAG: DUF309 domain-containing protein [Euryarchaeota archaeon TMED85]|tara:strand:+ start:400 stop:780 length:381 start_codon:yes stop_codon:yes gene_type:complete